jgi:hypothetical protein
MTMTLTYASATSVTVPTDVTSSFPVNAMLSFVQTEVVKYFNVVSATYSSPNTTIVLNGRGKYVVENATITSPMIYLWTSSEVAAAVHAATSKSTMVDADETGIADSAASFVLKKLTWGNVKSNLKTYFDDFYNLWVIMPGTPTRANDTSFTVTGDYSKWFSPRTIVKWEKSGGGFQCAMVVSATYSEPNTTITIVGNTLAAGFTSMKYCIHRAVVEMFIVPGSLPAAAVTDIAKTHFAEADLLVFSALVRYKTACTTTKGVWDINDDSTSIFATKPEIAATSTVGTMTVCDSLGASSGTTTTVVAAGSLITVDYDSGHATTPGSDAYIALYYMPESWRYLP